MFLMLIIYNIVKLFYIKLILMKDFVIKNECCKYINMTKYI